MTDRRPVADPSDRPVGDRSIRCDGGSDPGGASGDRSPRGESTASDRDAAMAALETVEEPVVTCAFVDGTPVVEWANGSFAETFDPSGGEVEGRALTDLVEGPTDDPYPEFDYGSYEGPVTRSTATGPRTFRLSVVPLEGDDERQISTYCDRSRQQEYERKVEALHESTRQLIGQESKESVARTAVDAAVEILGLAATSVHFVDRDRNVLPPAATTDEIRDLIGEPPDLPVDDSLAGRVFTTGESVVYEDPSEHPGVYNPDTPLESEVILPLSDHGVLLSGSTEPSAFTDADVSLATILASNTTAALDRIEREQTLARRERELARKNERLESFASMVSHDLRNPLNVAMGRLELASQECESEHLESAQGALDRMEELVRDLLELARTGDDIGAVKPVQVGDLARTAWDQVQTERATLTVADDTGTVEADPERLVTCFENLFRNAVEHAGPAVAVTVGPTGTGFFVADDGPGIPADRREDVFQAGHSGTDDGTGMGLAIVAEVAAAHGWDVTVGSSADGGARFEFDVRGRE